MNFLAVPPDIIALIYAQLDICSATSLSRCDKKLNYVYAYKYLPRGEYFHRAMRQYVLISRDKFAALYNIYHNLLDLSADNYCIFHGASIEILVKLIDRVKDQSAALRTFAYGACHRGDVEGLRFAVDRGTAVENTMTAIAVAHKQWNIVDALLDYPGIDPTGNDNAVVKKACKCGAIEIVEKIFQRFTLSPVTKRECLRGTVESGQYKLCEKLLLRADIFGHESAYEILEAAVSGMNELILKLLLADKRVTAVDKSLAFHRAVLRHRDVAALILLADPDTDPSYNTNTAVRKAAERGHAELMVQLLAHPKVDPTVYDNYPIRMAASRGYIRVVQLLLADPRVDPTAMNNNALKQARKNKHREILQMLAGKCKK